MKIANEISVRKEKAREADASRAGCNAELG